MDKRESGWQKFIVGAKELTGLDASDAALSSASEIKVLYLPEKQVSPVYTLSIDMIFSESLEFKIPVKAEFKIPIFPK